MAAASPRGTYLTIAEALRTQLTGDSAPTALPPESALMSTFGVARTTIRRALKALEAEGLIVPQPGVGWELASSEKDRRPLVERLADMIRVDRLSPGDKFPSEAKLCEAFGVSRPAIRGALAQLEGKGVLEAIPGKGRLLRALPSSDLSS